jgi:predicted AAA+ superfamily ATPase
MLFKRILMPEIIKYLPGPEALIILGSRQVGKTTLLKMIIEAIQPGKSAIYIDLEDPRNLEIVEKGPESLLDYIKHLGVPTNEKGYIFIDEIHYMKNPSRFIKLLVDHNSDKIKLVCTGSSSVGIRIKIHDALVGRKLTFFLQPLNFGEFLVFKGRKDLAAHLPTDPFNPGQNPTRYFQDDYLRYFHEYLIFGGYPRIVTEDDYTRKEKLLGEIVSAYIFKDIKSLFNIGDIHKFNDLVRVLASQTGSLLNVSGLAETIGISRPTVMNYVSILENSFLVSLLAPFSRSAQVEVRKAKKLYWFDNGLRNYLVGDLSVSASRTDIGILLESAVYSGLIKRKKEIEQIYYWRTKDKTEVDFVIKSGANIIPIEVKNRVRAHRGLMSFIKKYGIRTGYIAHLGDYIKSQSAALPAYWLA